MADKQTEEHLTIYQRIDRFHAHLDICSQCRNNPFGLCSTGAKLLKEAATGEDMCSILGKHYIENPQGNICAKCKYCGQWFRWDYGEHRYIPL